MFTVNREGLEDAAADVPALVSHAVAERLKDLLEKFAVVAEHRLDFNKVILKRRLINYMEFLNFIFLYLGR